MDGRRNFPRLIAASAASNLADGVFSLALPLVALSLTRDPAAFASVTVVGRLPWLLFALPAGAFADRLDRRRTMLLVNLGRTAVIGLLATVLLAGSEGLWMLYVVAFVLGVGETLFDTAAQSILPAIVPAAGLDRANGRLYAVELTANQFLGPPLGAIIAGVTLAGAVGFSSILYLAAGLALVTLTGSFRAVREGPATTVVADVREGIGYLARHRLLRVIAACVGISNLASTAMIAILPLYLIRPGPGGFTEAGYGLLLTTLAVGSVVGTLAVERLRRSLGARRTLLLATLSFPLFSLVPALTTSGVLLAVGFVVAGGISVSWNIITVSIRQRIVPDHLLGRVNAGYRLVAWGTMPLGAALGGLTAGALGLVPALVVSAAISALCFPLVLFGTPRDL
ncbi:MFS transporter [soil metagenome]